MLFRDIDHYLFGNHLRFGDGVSMHLINELAEMGLSRPVVLSQSRMAASAHYRACLQPLREGVMREFCHIPQHSSLRAVETIRDEVLDFRADCIVAIGGGSVSDSAKALAMLLAEGGRLTDHETQFVPPCSVSVPARHLPKLPIISLPTTASGAEVTPSFGVRDAAQHKHLFWNRQVASRSILIDPILSADMPMFVLRTTAMNGIAHCLEGLYSQRRSAISDGFALQAMRLFRQALDDEGLSERDQRRAILLAGHLSGMVLSMARSCLHHAICHVIGSRYDLAHGVVNAVILPHAVRFNAEHVAHLLEPVLALVNEPINAPKASSNHSRTPAYSCVSAWIEAVSNRFALPRHLASLGVTERDFDAIAQQTLGERGLAFNPREVNDAEQIKTILRQAL